ncbi:MAG: phage head closure protein [Burkholderiaceae bacterium]|nr:phage head closure protein [Burkholderiaceae bacterium]
MRAGQLNRRIRFERLDDVTDPNFGGSTQQWVPVVTVWAQVQDVLPSRAETVQQGVEITSRPARIRIHWRPSLTSAMRIVVLGQYPRTMQIVSGPAELGQRQGLEFMAEEFSV